jgi:hypothetical protein
MTIDSLDTEEYELEIAKQTKLLADLVENALTDCLVNFKDKTFAQGSIYFNLAAWYIGCVLLLSQKVTTQELTLDKKRIMLEEMANEGLRISALIKTISYN